MKKDNLNKAIRIASIVHAGTKGKSKEPAILHTIRVMMKMDDKKSRIVAVLHDVVESKKMNLDDLLNSGFSKNVCHTIDLCIDRNTDHGPRKVTQQPVRGSYMNRM